MEAIPVLVLEARGSAQTNDSDDVRGPSALDMANEAHESTVIDGGGSNNIRVSHCMVMGAGLRPKKAWEN